MKTYCAAFLCILVPALSAFGQRQLAAEPEPLRVTERGPHHKVWQRVTPRVTSYGKTYLITNSYTELATGMHYDVDGRWVESQEVIEPAAGGAVAHKGAHKAAWAANLNTAGAFQMVTPDGKRFSSHILGLAYTDAATGKSVLIAELKDCVGEIIGNQILYRDAFDGPFRADVRYTYTRSGISQDILIREAIPSPSDYQLDPESVRIETWTEFTEAAPPTRSVSVLKPEPDTQRRQNMIDPDLTDETLDFGAMRIGSGSAFPLDDQNRGIDKQSEPVGKTWIRIENRNFLIEKTDFRDIKTELEALPRSAALNKRANEELRAAAKSAPTKQQLLAGLTGPVRKERNAPNAEMRVAAVSPPEKGFVLDYSMVSSATNFTFKSDTTYFISGNVTLAGTTVLEPAIIKFTNGNSTARLSVNGPLDCRTDSYRPAIFTGKDDNTVGEVISGSTGNPTNHYGYYLDISGNTNVIDLHNVHMRRGYYGVNMASASKLVLRHAQISSNYAGVVIQSGQVRLRNVLIHDGTYAFGGGGTNNWCEHVTFHRLGNMRSAGYNTFITNSLIISVTNNVVFTGTKVVTNLNGSGFFQTVGLGQRYLVAGSTNRNSGTTNINADLLADLKTRTTHPPNVLATINQSTNLSAVVERDETQPDLGYHYDALDYLLGSVAMTNVTLTVTNGAAIAIDCTVTNYGIRLASGAAVISEGTPLKPNRFLRNHSVQEIAAGPTNNLAPIFADTFPAPATATTLRARFTEFPLLTRSYLFNQERGRGTLTSLILQDSQIHGGLFYCSGSQSNIVIGLTNCLLDRVKGEFYDYTQSKVSVFNALFRGGNWDQYATMGSIWTWKDNFFDKTTISQSGSGTFTHDYNGYVTNSSRLTPNGANDKVLTNSPVYEIGALGRYYLPQNLSLIDGGSRSAANAGLYHYTTAANQAKEAYSTVDIGFHYVALNAQNLPVDSDGDGTADYVEDVNGNGVSDANEGSFINPAITLSGTPLAYVENDPAKIIDSGATFTDPDSANLSGGTLLVSFSANGLAEDRLAIQNQGSSPGQIGVSGNTLTYGGTTIGTFNGGTDLTNLAVSFNSSSSPESAQALLRVITYSNISEAPSALARTVQFTATDGRGGISSPAYKTVNVTPVNDPPVLALGTNDFFYAKGSPPLVIDPDITVTNIDSSTFAGGQLLVTFGEAAMTNDHLLVKNLGTGAGQIGVNGTNILYGGTPFANYAGGVGTNALQINFGAAASVAAVQALLTNVTYENTEQLPEDSSRLLEIKVIDDQGASSEIMFKAAAVSCPQSLDVMLVIDVSNSLTANSFAAAKRAASTFVSYLRPGLDHVGVATIHGSSDVKISLRGLTGIVGDGINDTVQEIRSFIEDPSGVNLPHVSGTQLIPAILNCEAQFLQNGRVGATRIMVMMTDGELFGETDQQVTTRALETKGKEIRIITVGFLNQNTYVNTALLTAIATTPNDYFAPNGSTEIGQQLEATFASVATKLCQENTPPTLTALGIPPTLKPIGNGLTFAVPEWGGGSGNPRVALRDDGGRAFVALDDSRLRVVDTSSPGTPVELGAATLASLGRFAVSKGGDRLYAFGIFITRTYDVSNPQSMSQISAALRDGDSGLPWDGPGLSLSPDGKSLWLSEDTAGFRRIGIEKPSVGPLFFGGHNTVNIALSRDGARLYQVVKKVLGGPPDPLPYKVNIYDISNPSAPIQRGVPILLDYPDHYASLIETSPDGNAVYLYKNQGSEVFAVGIYDVSNPSTPIPLDEVPVNAAQNMHLSKDGTMLYLTGSNGLAVIDVSNPANATLLETPPLGSLSDLALSPDQNVAYTTSLTPNQTHFVAFDVGTNELSAVSGGQPITVNLNVSDRETPYTSLVVERICSNPSLLPLANINITYSGTGPLWTMQITPPASGFGLAAVTVTVKDIENLVATKTFNVCIKPATPLINAGPDQTTLVLDQNGSVPSMLLDGSLINTVPCVSPPATPSVLWTVTKGPGLVTIADPTSPVTTAAFSAPGNYTFRLEVTDTPCKCISDEVSVVVTENQPPNVQITTPCDWWEGLPPCNIGRNDIAFAGTVQDPDGYPGGPLRISWSKVSGPGSVKFIGSPNSASTSASFSAPGLYVLHLTASDGLSSAYDEIHVNVGGNQTPVANAGPDQTVEFGELVYLPGIVTDDGAPTEPYDYLNVTWAKLSGPGTVTFDDFESPTTFASFSQLGTYVLQLKGDDGVGYLCPDGCDTVTIVVAEQKSLHVIYDTDVVSAGVGGLRGFGEGSISLTGISGTVKKALLYWHGPTDTADPLGNSSVLLNGRLVVGRNIGFSQNNSWVYDKEGEGIFGSVHFYPNSQAYYADITPTVKSFGDGNYTLSKFFKTEVLNVNGASMIVFFNDPNQQNNHDVVVAHGNDSNRPDKFNVDYEVFGILVQPDGKILISGDFAFVNDDIRTRIARFNPDGTLDQTFDIGHGLGEESGANNTIFSMALQADGKVLAAGRFEKINDVDRNMVARFLSNGTLDTSFDPGPVDHSVPMGAKGVRHVSIQNINNQERILVAGKFVGFGGQPWRKYIVRLKPDGSFDDDEEFDPFLEINGEIRAVAVDSQNRIVIGGKFSTINGTVSRYLLARLDQHGYPDLEFDPQITSGSSVNSIAIDSVGNIVIGGDFNTIEGTARSHLARLLPNGTLDPTFDPGTGPSAAVESVALSGGNVYIAGHFIEVNGISRKRIARLNNTGAVDSQFNPGAGISFHPTDSAAWLNTVTKHGDGVLIGGYFGRVGDLDLAHVARLTSLGTPDATVHSGGWAFQIPNVRYTGGPAALEVHVGDAQHAQGGSFYADRDIIVRSSLTGGPGQSFVQPEPVLSCDNFTFDNFQVFGGYESPLLTLWNYSCEDNMALWDARRFEGLDDYLTSSEQVQTLTLESDGNFLPEQDLDAISVVAALVILPPGSVLPEPAPPVTPPAEISLRTMPDAIQVNRSLGVVMANVLANDRSSDGRLLRITSVSAPGQGVAEIVYHESAIRYRLNLGASGNDSFSYTVQDSNGNSATETVAVDIVGPHEPILLEGNQVVSGVLTVTDALTTVRGANQYADFYQFFGVFGDKVSISYLPEDFQGHVFIKDPNGDVVAFGSHRFFHHVPVFSAEIDDFELPVDGIYTIEVTTHSPNETGPYYLHVSFTTATPQPVLEVTLGNTIVPKNGSVHLGILQNNSHVEATLRNVGETSISLDEIRFEGLGNAIFTISPHRIEGLEPGQSATVSCELISTLETGEHMGAFKLFSPESTESSPFFVAGLTAFLNPQSEEGADPIEVIVPGDGTTHVPPAPLRITARVIDTDGLGFWPSLASFTFCAQSSVGNQKIGYVEINDLNVSQEPSVLWLEPEPGVYSVRVTGWMLNPDLGVYSLSVSEPIHIIVRSPLPNESPIAANDSFNLPMGSPPTVLDVLANDREPDGDPLRITQVIQGYGTVLATADGKKVRYTPPADASGTDRFRYTVTDGHGRNATASAFVNIIQTVVQITSPANLSAAMVNASMTIEATASTSQGAISRVEFFVNDKKLGHDDASLSNTGSGNSQYTISWSTNQIGYYTLIAVAIDSSGNAIKSAPVRIAVTANGQPPAGSPPVAIISNLKDNQIIREGFVDVQGTASDPDGPPIIGLRLLNPKDDSVAMQADASSLIAVVDGPIGKLDTSKLRNGSYDVELEISQGFGSATARVRVVVDSQVKVGQFTFTEQDLSFQVGGASLAITRTYDSFKTDQGDFGHSWTLGILDLEAEIDEDRQDTPTDPDFPNGDKLPMRVGGGRNVTLNLPGGQRTTFVFSLVPGPSNDGDPCFCYQAKWTPPPGVFATLTPHDNDILQFMPFSSKFPPYWLATDGPGTPIDNFDFTGFTLTVEDGTKFELTRPLLGEVELDPEAAIPQSAAVYGKLKLTQITSRDGERTVISTDTANHKDRIKQYNVSGTEMHSVQIIRDPDPLHNNRVKEIYGPDSLTTAGELQPGALPAVKYDYYEFGDLRDGNLYRVHRLVDRQTALYAVTKYLYGEPNAPEPTDPGYDNNPANPHYITGIVGPNGVPAYTKYDAEGRLAEVKDAGGNITKFTHEIDGRKEIITDVSGNVTVHEYDTRGNVLLTVNPLGHVTRRTYDNSNNQLSETDGLGNKTTFEYDANGNRAKTIDPLDRVSTATYNGFGQVLTTTSPKQYLENPGTASTVNYYNGDTGDLLAIQDANGTLTTYAYYANGLLESVTDAQGNKTVHTYYEQGQPGGKPGDLKTVSVQQNNIGSLTTLNTTEFTYDAKGRRSTETVSGSGIESLVTKYEYDEQDRVIKTIADFGVGAENLNYQDIVNYDAAGRVASRTDRLQRTTSYDYDKKGNVVRIRYPSGGTFGTPETISTMVYDDNNRVIYRQDQHTEPGILPPSTCNICDTCAGCTVANGFHYIYDSAGRQIRSERLLGIRVKVTGPDANSHFACTFEGAWLWNHEDTDSDPFKDVPLTAGTSTEYDAAGRVIVSTDNRTGTTRYEYDAAGQRTAVVNTLDQRTTFGYDENGNQAWFQDAKEQRTDYVYDKLNRRVVTVFPEIVTGQPRYTLQTLYNSLGHRVAETNQANIVTRFLYDSRGLLTAVTNAWGLADETVTRYVYDGRGNMLEQTDAEQRHTTFQYDKFGRRIRRTLPLGQFELTSYDAVGNRILHTNFNNTTIPIPNTVALGFQYDALNRLRRKDRVTWPSGETRQTLVSYDYTSNGKRKEIITDPVPAANPSTYKVKVNYTYQYNEWMAKKETSIKNVSDASYTSKTLEYTHDSGGRLTKLITPGDGFVQYEWDELNRLKHATKSDGNQIASYVYDSVGNLDSVTYPNHDPNQPGGVDVTTRYTYDSLNRLLNLETRQTVSGALLASFNYQSTQPDRKLSPLGQRRIADEAIGASARVVHYDYDDLGRLKKEDIVSDSSGAAGSIEYDSQPGYADIGFDRVGNRRSRIVSSPSLQAYVPSVSPQSFDADDRLDPDPNPLNPNPNYDNNGSTLRGDVPKPPTYDDLYDLEGRLIQRRASLPDDPPIPYTVNLDYDGEGNRVRKLYWRDATPNLRDITIYVVDDQNPTGYTQVIEEWDGATSARRLSYAYGLDLVSQRTWAPTTEDFYFGYDGHGSVRYIFRRNGDFFEGYNFDAFGIRISADTQTTHYLYAGEQWDSDLGLYYNRARYLNPNTGRFWTMDSYEGDLSNPLSLHKYLYAHADPVNGIDPSGYSTFSYNEQMAVRTITLLLAVAVFESSRVALTRGGAFLGPRYSTRSQVRSRTKTDPAPQPKPKPNEGYPPPPPPDEDEDDQSLNRMRLQLQDDDKEDDHYWSTVLKNKREIGVTVRQVRDGLEAMHEAVVADLTDKEFPYRLEPQLYSAIILFSQKLDSVRAGGGVTQRGNVLREKFYDRDVEFRIDLENLNGKNLTR